MKDDMSMRANVSESHRFRAITIRKCVTNVHSNNHSAGYLIFPSPYRLSTSSTSAPRSSSQLSLRPPSPSEVSTPKPSPSNTVIQLIRSTPLLGTPLGNAGTHSPAAHPRISNAKIAPIMGTFSMCADARTTDGYDRATSCREPARRGSPRVARVTLRKEARRSAESVVYPQGPVPFVHETSW